MLSDLFECFKLPLMLSVVILYVIMQNVFKLNVVAPVEPIFVLSAMTIFKKLFRDKRSSLFCDDDERLKLTSFRGRRLALVRCFSSRPPDIIFKLFSLSLTLQTKNLITANTLAYLYRVRVTQREMFYTVFLCQ